MEKWDNIQFNVYTIYNYVIPCVTTSDTDQAMGKSTGERDREQYHKNNNIAEKKGKHKNVDSIHIYRAIRVYSTETVDSVIGYSHFS